MNSVELRAAIVTTFLSARSNGMALGISELLAAIRLLDSEYLESLNTSKLIFTLKLLWCKSETDEWVLTRTWAAAYHKHLLEEPRVSSEAAIDVSANGALGKEQEQTHLGLAQDSQPRVDWPQLSFLPFQSSTSPHTGAIQTDFQSYLPVSRRFMSYVWNSLRRLAYQGYQGTPDIDGTVDNVARTGYLIRPIYERRVVNRVRVLLFLDCLGSMMPFGRYLRDLLGTLEESEIDANSRAIYYFQNVPGSVVFHNRHLTQPIPLVQALQFADHETSVLIVSDAGAARGHARNRKRVRDTLDFLYSLYDCTYKIAWLNPMPSERWEDTSAESIAASVPMFPMDEQGLSGAVDMISGRVAMPLSSVLQ